MRLPTVGAISVLVFGCLGCGNPAASFPFDGTWHLTLSAPYSGSGTIIVKDGRFDDIIPYSTPNVSGALAYMGNVDDDGHVQGQIVFMLFVVGSLEGTLAGDAGSGTYTITDPTPASGTWSATRD